MFLGLLPALVNFRHIILDNEPEHLFTAPPLRNCLICICVSPKYEMRKPTANERGMMQHCGRNLVVFRPRRGSLTSLDLDRKWQAQYW